SELATKKPINVYRRNLQKAYVDMLDHLLNPKEQQATLMPGGGRGPVDMPQTKASDISDAGSVIRAHLTALKREITAAIAGTTDLMSKYHLQDVARMIDNALNPK